MALSVSALLHPGHLFCSLKYAMQMPQFMPQGATSEYLFNCGGMVSPRRWKKIYVARCPVVDLREHSHQGIDTPANRHGHTSTLSRSKIPHFFVVINMTAWRVSFGGRDHRSGHILSRNGFVP